MHAKPTGNDSFDKKEKKMHYEKYTLSTAVYCNNFTYLYHIRLLHVMYLYFSAEKVLSPLTPCTIALIRVIG